MRLLCVPFNDRLRHTTQLVLIAVPMDYDEPEQQVAPLSSEVEAATASSSGDLKQESESKAVSVVPSSSTEEVTADPAASVDKARSKLQTEIRNQRSADEDEKERITAIQTVLKDHDGLKDKVNKLKSLLGRSAKAQREAKVDLDATQKRLEAALREIERLNKKIEKLSNRPTHMVRAPLSWFPINIWKAISGINNVCYAYTSPPYRFSLTGFTCRLRNKF